MLEEPMKMLNDLKVNFEDFDKNELTWAGERRKCRDKTIARLDKIFYDTKNPSETKIIAAELGSLKFEMLVILANNNVFRNMFQMLLINTEYSLAVIDRELAQLKKPAGSTTGDTEKIKQLEENIANFKNQLETIKPIFQKLKKDYATRKKYLNGNR